MRKTRIISAFPGTGKTTFCKNIKDFLSGDYTVTDSDSSKFSWIEDENGKKFRNPEFPKNYIEHIKDCIGKYDFILVSSHKEVRDALVKNCLFFYLVYPEVDSKEEYIKRYKDRGNAEELVNRLDENWCDWISQCWFCEFGCQQVCMNFKYIDDELQHIVCMENGETK
jgi:adenylate kinase family enzyme